MVRSFDSHPAQYWHKLDDGRIQCDLCPRFCRLHEDQRALGVGTWMTLLIE